MTERAYTVKEIDALRRACADRWLHGTTNLTGSRVSRPFYQKDMDRGVEELIRTYMMAGLVASDIYAADNPTPEHKEE